MGFVCVCLLYAFKSFTHLNVLLAQAKIYYIYLCAYVYIKPPLYMHTNISDALIYVWLHELFYYDNFLVIN